MGSVCVRQVLCGQNYAPSPKPGLDIILAPMGPLASAALECLSRMLSSFLWLIGTSLAHLARAGVMH